MEAVRDRCDQPVPSLAKVRGQPTGGEGGISANAPSACQPVRGEGSRQVEGWDRRKGWKGEGGRRNKEVFLSSTGRL